MGDRLDKALEVSGVKVTEMAMILGVSRQTIGNYLSGRTTPKLGVLKVWADETGVDLEWLKTGEIPPGIHGPYPVDQPRLFDLAA